MSRCNRLTRSALAIAMALQSACASVTPHDYVAEQPKLDLAQFFTGTVDGWGTVQNRSGKVIRRLKVVINCTWQGTRGRLDESFVWSDGKTEHRVWTLDRVGDRYTGTAGDVVGSAIGVAEGNALQWQYVLALSVNDSTYHMDMDDWMWQLDESTMMNRTKMSKYRITFAEISIFFRKR